MDKFRPDPDGFKKIDKKNKMIFVISSPISIVSIIFYSVVVFFWGLFLIAICHIFLLSILWFSLGFSFIFILLWNMFGNERISVNEELFVVERRFLNIPFRKKKIPIDKINLLENIECFWYDDLDYSARKLDFLKFSVGSISLKYSDKELKFANELNPEKVVSLLNEFSRIDSIKSKIKINDLSVKDELNNKKKKGESLLPDQFEEF